MGADVTGIIPPGQLDFDNADRSHGAWSSIYKAAAEEGAVRMTLNDGAVSDEAIVYFNSDAQDNFDDFDSHKFWASDVPQLYMNSSADTVAINGLYSTATNPVVDLGIKAPLAGDYTLNANSITVVGETVHLEDRLLNIFQDLNEAPSYAFTSEAGNIGNRFALHFGMSVTGIEGGVVNSRVFAADRLVNVSVGNDITTGMITILDMAGRTVQTAAINGSRTVVATDLITGIYLVRVETKKGAETHKVMLR